MNCFSYLQKLKQLLTIIRKAIVQLPSHFSDCHIQGMACIIGEAQS